MESFAGAYAGLIHARVCESENDQLVTRAFFWGMYGRDEFSG